jgi:hypothetical protein
MQKLLEEGGRIPAHSFPSKEGNKYLDLIKFDSKIDERYNQKDH